VVLVLVVLEPAELGAGFGAARATGLGGIGGAGLDIFDRPSNRMIRGFGASRNIW